MFRLLAAQMILSNINKKDLAKKIDMNYSVFCEKFSGRRKFTFEEAIRIKSELSTDLDVESLFSTSSTAKLVVFPSVS